MLIDEHIIIRGIVMRGDGYGKLLGFPTANLDRRAYVKLKTKPEFGIYAGYGTIGPRRHKAAIVIGPLDAKKLPKIEAHLLGYSGNLYGKKIAIELVQYIRAFKPYTSERELILQIGRDVAKVNKIIK